MTQNFVDVSSYQGGIDFSQLDCDGVIIKVSGGTGYLNPYAAAQHASALAAGKIIRLYHYGHEIGYQGTAEAEAAFFLANAAPLMQGVEGLDLDYESDNKSDTAWAKRFLDIISGSSPTAPYFYANLAMLLAYDWTGAGVTQYPLWLAWYPYNTPQGWGPLSGLPALKHWAAPAVWQYSSTGLLNGWGGNLDLSIRYDSPITTQGYTPEEDTLSQAEVLQIQGFINGAQTEIQKSLEVTQQFFKDLLTSAAFDIKTFDQKAGQDEGGVIINEVRANAAMLVAIASKNPTAVAAAIPADIAKAVADELAKRLAS
ncbi:GH25 family lysozyme [bacterium RCC_150]